MTRLTLRLGLGAAALVAAASLSACAPAVVWPGASLAPAQSSCPEGLVDSVRSAVLGDSTAITFSEVGIDAIEPAALRGFFAGGCVMGFGGELGQGARIDGVYAFAVTPVDEGALHAALEGAGFTESSQSWTKPGANAAELWEVLTESAESISKESLLDLSSEFPEATFLLASFHTTVDPAAIQ